MSKHPKTNILRKKLLIGGTLLLVSFSLVFSLSMGPWGEYYQAKRDLNGGQGNLFPVGGQLKDLDDRYEGAVKQLQEARRLVQTLQQAQDQQAEAQGRLRDLEGRYLESRKELEEAQKLVQALRQAQSLQTEYDEARLRWANETSVAGGIIVVVAAVDSSDVDKARANFVARGIDDQKDISAAIAALPDTGGMVFLAEGNYTGGQLLIQRNNISLVSDGGATYKVADNTNAAAIVLGGSDTTTYFNIRVKGLRVNGNYYRQNQPIYKSIVQATAILAYNVSGFWIEDNYLYDAYQHGINAEKSYNGVISGNYAENQGDDAIGTSEDSHDITIIGNTVRGGRMATGTSSGVEVEDGSYRITVSGNTITLVTPQSMGINLKHHSGRPSPNYIHDITVTGNRVYAPRHTLGIHVYDQDEKWGSDWNKNINITNNTLVGATDELRFLPAVLVEWAENITLENNVIYGFWRGIDTSQARNMVIRGNMIDSPTREGILAGDDQVLEYNTVMNAGRRGICLSGKKGVKVVHNTVLNPGVLDRGWAPIHWDSASTDIEVRDNRVN